MKNLFLRVGRLWCLGLGLLLMRMSQNQSGFDPVTGLSVRNVPGTLSLAVLAVYAVGELMLFFKNPKEKNEFSAQFNTPDKELLAVVLGALLLAAGGILLAIQGFRQGTLQSAAAVGVTGVLAVAAGAGILLLNRRARAGERLTVMPMLPAMFFAVFYVLALYIPIGRDPVFARYYLLPLTGAMIACSFSLLAGFLQKESSPRAFIFAGDLTVVLCLMSIADGNPARMLLFAGCALVLSVYLLLCREKAAETA